MVRGDSGIDIEWTCEGSLKVNLFISGRLRVCADGDLNRYLQECMMVHDEVGDFISSSWVVPQENIRTLVPFPENGRETGVFLL